MNGGGGRGLRDMEPGPVGLVTQVQLAGHHHVYSQPLGLTEIMSGNISNMILDIFCNTIIDYISYLPFLIRISYTDFLYLDKKP